MKILTRYIFREMFGPTVLGFGFYTFILMMKQLFDFAGMIIRRSLPASTVVKLLLLSLPHVIVLTVPMSLLFGILIAIGRMSADSEITAMRALGISTRTIYRPVFLFSLLVFLLSLYLMNVVLPRGNREFMSLKAEVLTSSFQKDIKPRIFYDEFENLMIYVDDIDPRSGNWKGVFVSDNRTSEDMGGGAGQGTLFGGEKSAQKIVAAESGTLSVVQTTTKQIWLNLRSAQNHIWDPRKPERYDVTNNATQRILISDKLGVDSSVTGRIAPGLREMNLRELVEQERLTQRSRDQETYRLAKVEIQKKFAIPFACIVFGVLGLPLGITNRRGGKSSGFSLSIAIILFYYVLINNGETLAAAGKVNAFFGMWTPNLILLAAGIYLLIRANREIGASRGDRRTLRQVIASLARLPRRRSSARRSLAEDQDEEPVLRRLDITFPNILDRYIIREFVKILALVVISTAALFVIVDYTDLAQDIRQHHIAFHTVFAYFRFSIFNVLNYTIPISVLVSTLVVFGIFSKNNEVTAFKSGGVSLYRVALPIVGMAGIICVLSYLMLDYVLPYANARSEDLRNKMKGKGAVAVQHQQKLWFIGKGRYLINFLSYDRDTRALSQVQVFELHPTAFRITRRVYAQQAKWDGDGWVFRNGWIRSFNDAGTTATFTPIAQPVRLYYRERPEDFATEVKTPDQMTFTQLRRYIETIRRSGYSAEELSVKLYEKTSWPFLSMVMALIALPFAFKIGKRGALYGVGIALVLGIAYWMVFALFTKFGEVGNLPPALSAWSANVLFAISAVYLFLNVET